MAKGYFSDDDLNALSEAISQAEMRTSGELRVHVEKRCKEDVMDRAAFVFEKLKMHLTEQRSGVLFYLSIKDRKFAILGDAGINAKIEAGFWDQIKDRMMEKFRQERPVEGLKVGIAMAGEKLKDLFPIADQHLDELSNEVSFGSDLE